MAQPPRFPAPNPWIYSKNSAIHGRGVYAKKPIPQETRLVEYVGEKISKAEAQRRETDRLRRQFRGEEAGIFIFVLNQRHDLDGSSANNLARLINHSCSPNCRAETARGHIWLFALRDLAPDEELTFDYGFPFREWPFHPCRCGSPKCARFIVNSAQRWRVRRIFCRLRNPEKIAETRRLHAEKLKPSSGR